MLLGRLICPQRKKMEIFHFFLDLFKKLKQIRADSSNVFSFFLYNSEDKKLPSIQKLVHLNSADFLKKETSHKSNVVFFKCLNHGFPKYKLGFSGNQI